MKKVITVALLALMLTLVLAPVVLASEAEGEMSGEMSNAKLEYYSLAVIGCGLAIGIAALGTGIGQGIGLSKACDGVARNPGASGKVMTTLIVGLAMIESLCIYALVVVLIVLYANPFGI